MPSGAAAAVTAGDREVLRLVPPVVLWWVWVAFVVANVADFTVQGLSSARLGAVVSAVLLFVTGLVYALALRPRVIVDGTGLTVVNPFRVHHVPWRLIQSVDTGEWMRVRYAARADRPAGGPPAGGDSPPAGGDSPPAGGDSPGGGDGPGGAAAPRPCPGTAPRTLHCWALYVSARARRKIARGAPRPRRGLFAAPGGSAAAPGEHPRLPDEARYLASLPVVTAIAARLDARAARERARAAGPARPPGQAAVQSSGQTATVSWSWQALAATVIPALILLVVAVL